MKRIHSIFTTKGTHINQVTCANRNQEIKCNQKIGKTFFSNSKSRSPSFTFIDEKLGYNPRRSYLRNTITSPLN